MGYDVNKPCFSKREQGFVLFGQKSTGDLSKIPDFEAGLGSRRSIRGAPLTDKI
jgi:hypothetical protein